MKCDHCDNDSVFMLQNGELRCNEHTKVKKEYLSINKCIEYLKENKHEITEEQISFIYDLWFDRNLKPKG